MHYDQVQIHTHEQQSNNSIYEQITMFMYHCKRMLFAIVIVVILVYLSIDIEQKRK
jgi:DNA-directed RNA polymerase subunit N (RpoN/RPB10)